MVGRLEAKHFPSSVRQELGMYQSFLRGYGVYGLPWVGTSCEPYAISSGVGIGRNPNRNLHPYSYAVGIQP